MTSVKKPAFPTIQPQTVNKTLDKLADTVKSSREADGSVNVEALEAKVESSGNQVLAEGLEAIKDAFQRTETQPVNTGCGGGATTHDVKVDPKNLDSGEVQNVMSALLAAKSEVQSLDSNRDGRLDRQETKAAGNLDGLSGALAEAAVDDSTAGFKAEMSDWNKALSETANGIEARKKLDGKMVSTARKHAASETGAEAITWAYRDLATQPAGVDIWDMDERLSDAETSWLRFIPLFGRLTRGDGHLSDGEVKKLLGTDDLAGFCARKRGEIEGRIGGEYSAHYLAGKDLAGVDQLDDPDFNRVRSSC